MAEVFNWNRPGYEFITVKSKWNVQVPFLQTTKRKDQHVESPLFSSPKNPNSKWQLKVFDCGKEISITPIHYNSAGKIVGCAEPVIVIISILNIRGEKVFQQQLQISINQCDVDFRLNKGDVLRSECQQGDRTSYTFSCKIFTHVKKETLSAAGNSSDVSSDAINCLNELSTHLCGLFNNMSLSDVILNVRGREFPAHKVILAARSEVFAAMFKHPMTEQSTNQIEIEDIEPEVFQELLRFIYTGRVSRAAMESMAANLFIAADKYLLDELKMKCEIYLLYHMSPENCAVLLLHGDLRNPTEPLKEAATFFRRLPSQVMATERWEKTKKENLVLLYDIQQFVFCFK